MVVAKSIVPTVQKIRRLHTKRSPSAIPDTSPCGWVGLRGAACRRPRAATRQSRGSTTLKAPAMIHIVVMVISVETSKGSVVEPAAIDESRMLSPRCNIT